MKARTSDFKNLISSIKETKSKITYTINGTSIELGDEELNSIQPHYEGGILTSVMKQLDLDSNVEIPNSTIINLQFGVKVREASGNDDGYDYINYGNYIVKESEKKEDTNSYLIKCYDKMLYSMKDYEKLKYRNLFDKDNANVLNAYINASGVITSNSPDRTIWLPITPNTDYTFQMTQKALSTSTSADDVRITLFNTQPALSVSGTNVYSQTRTSATSDYNYIKTFNSGNNSYVAIKILNTSKSNYDETLATLLLEKGTNVTEYEPFGDIQYPISIRKYIDLLCFNIGLTFKNANDTFTNYDRTIESELYLDENGNSLNYTFRDVLDELAQVTASTICINETDDELEIRYITNAGETTTNVNGTNLSITSEDSKTNKIELLGNTTQSGTPTPSSPQNVETVTGLQEIKSLGKNLYDGSKDFSGTWEYASAWTTDTATFNGCVVKKRAGSWSGLYKTFPVVSGKKYTYSIYAKADEGRSCGLYLSNAVSPTNATISVTTNWARYSITFTANSNGTIKPRLENQTASTTNYTYIACPQLEEGTLTDYEYVEETNEINLGKNLLTTNYFINVATVTINDATNNDFTYYGCWGTDLINNSNLLKILKPSTTYTISFKFKIIERPDSFGQYNTPSICILYGGSQTISFQDARKNTAELDTWLDFSSTFTMPSSLSGYRFLLYNFKDTGNNTTGKIEIADLQIEEGSVATDFAPYFTPIELCKIGTYEDKMFKTSGKNLFNKDNPSLLDGYVNYNTGVFTSPNTNNQKCFYIKVEPSTTYTWSGYTTSASVGYGLFNSIPSANDTASSYGQITSTKTITTGANDNYLVMFYTALNTSVDVSSFQLEKNSSATNYEPYSNNEWYVKKAIGKVVLNGSETWTTGGTSTSGKYRLKNNDISTLVKKPSANNVKIPLYSNYYKDTTADNTYLSNVGVSIATNGGIYIYDSNYTTSDVSLYKTWLSTHNTIVYYPLASPTYEKLNDTLQEELNSIRLLEGLNNIMSSVPIDLTYVSGIDTLDEEYFNEDNVNFGEIYGPVNTIILSRSAESDEIAQSIPSNLSDDEKVAIKISDNQIMNFDNRDEFLYGILTRLYGLRYVQNDYSSKGICYYDLCDRYRADIFGKSYYCVMLNDDVTIESGLSENVFTEIPDTAKTEYSNTTTTDRLERRTTLIVDKQVGEIRAEISTIDDQLNGANGVTSKLNAQGQTLDIWSKSFDENGNVIALNTTNYTFDNEGLKIGKSTDDYNSLQDNTGTYYYEKDTMTGKYTKEGSVQKDMALFGRYYYGIDEENFDVSTFSLKDANFVAQWYDNGNEEGFGHFWNGE